MDIQGALRAGNVLVIKMKYLPKSRKTVTNLLLFVILSMAAISVQATEYYINDGSTNGDVYTDRAGDDYYTGTNPCCPRASIQAILADYSLSPGDIIYVDTGNYLLTNDILFTATENGSSGSPVEIRGTTNLVMDSLFQRSVGGPGNKYGLHLSSADYIHVNNLVFTGGTAAIFMENTEGCSVSNVAVSGVLTYGFSLLGASDMLISDVSLLGADTALYLEGVTNCTLSNLTVSGASSYGCHFKDAGPIYLTESLVVNNDTGIKVEDATNDICSCVLAYNVDNQVELSGGFLTLTNSILAATNSGAYCIYWTAGEYRGDYNNFYARCLQSCS